MYGKLGLGLNLTIGDLFGVAQGGNSLQPIGSSSAGPLSWTWSGIRANAAFQNGSFPLPIHVSCNRWDQRYARTLTYLMQMLGEVRPVGVPGANPYQSPVNGTILQPTYK